MNHVGPYWRGVTQRLQAEVEQMNQLIDHQGAKGTENELSLARLVENLVPTRFGVGSGLLVDAKGRSSKQMDLVVYERGTQPGIFAQTNEVLFPVENVRLCIEVKTRLTQAALEDGREKKNSIQALSSSTELHPPLALFGYGASLGPGAVADHLDADVTALGPRPDVTIAVRPALLVGSLPGRDGWTRAVAGLQERDAEGIPIAGTLDMPSKEDKTSVLRAGVAYPLAQIADVYAVVEPSRALLLFAEWVVSILHDGPGVPVLSAYIDAVSRELTAI